MAPNGRFVQPAVFQLKSDLEMAFIYLGKSPRTNSKDFTCFMQNDEHSGKVWIIGLYNGDGVRPIPLDEQYGFAGDFADDGGLYVWQYNLNKQLP